jgi:lipoprotein-releasing system permease protein
VSGIFRSGLYDFDAGYAYVPIEDAQRLFGLADVASAIEVQIEDINRAAAMGPGVAAAGGEGLEFVDWTTQNMAIFEALALERLVMFITIGLIVIVASLNIVVTLVMMVMEKTRDIAVLMSMGATRENIRRIFIAQGVIIGVVGTVLGLLIGNLTSYLADAYQLVRISPDVYSIAYVPFQTSLSDSAIVAAAAVLISYVATLYPSRAAAGLQPVEALRYE